MNIPNFQNSITPEIRNIISKWLDSNCFQSERKILFDDTYGVLIKLINHYHTRSSTVEYVSSIFKSDFTRDMSTDVVLKTYLLLMLDHDVADMKISIAFRENVYRARLNRFLELLYKSIKIIERNKGKTDEYQIVK